MIGIGCICIGRISRGSCAELRCDWRGCGGGIYRAMIYHRCKKKSVFHYCVYIYYYYVIYYYVYRKISRIQY